MKFISLRYGCWALLLSLFPAMADESHYIRMVESKPVGTNGLEFIAATEAEWTCGEPPPRAAETIQVQLLIRNTTSKPLLFTTFDTFGIIIRDSQGKEIKPTGGRDATMRTKPVLIEPGGRYCLCRKAEFGWNRDGKSRCLDYFDGTGSRAHYSPLSTGSYTLSFRCNSNPWDELAPDTNEDPNFVSWHGKLVTQAVAFQVVAP